jgi:uncharacterized protein (TIGR02217 family)
MSYPIMPALPISMAAGLKKSPNFNTVKQTTAAGMTSAVSLKPYPTWDFELSLDHIQGQESVATSVLAQFMSVYMATSGGAGLFLFQDPQDSTVTASQFGVGNGATTSFQLSRTINGAQDIIQNWITPPSVYANGVLSTTALISNTGVVVFSTAPATGAVLTVTGTFYFLCRFAEDTIDAVRSFTRNSGVDLWDVSSIKFSSEYVSPNGSGVVGTTGSGITYSGTSGVTIPVVATTLPIVDGTATIGATGKYADAGHIHPTDTSRQAALGYTPVANTITVNGHALSANVTVSASDITTGTLPHAQLPALVSGDIPANAANTSGSAASFTGSLVGDVTGTQGATVVGKINGATMPASAPLLGTNSSSQLISVTTVPAANLPKATTAALGAIHLPTVTTYTSGSGTYTTPTGATMLHVRLVGGGGGGVGSGSSTSNGSAGNATSFGTSFLTANGGGAGTGQAGGVAGTASGGTVNITGGDGGSARALSSTALFEPGGIGGASAFGGGGAGGSQAAGNTGKAYGSGGGGGGIGTNTAYSAAGGGAGGFVEAWVTSPSATYAYSVGTGGTGGTAGTNGFAGGTGAAGIIIIEAY